MSETRPCYKRDCDVPIWTTAEPITYAHRLKPDPAIKGIATIGIVRIPNLVRVEILSETRPCYKRDCDLLLGFFASSFHRLV